jgi:hypothetical protein
MKVDEGAHVVLGRDVFVLWVGAGFDAAFSMDHGDHARRPQ